jgi:hypothetical protein
MSFFSGWDDSPRGPAVHHREGLPLAGEVKVDGVWVHYGRDGDYLHVQSLHGRHLGQSLAPGAPISALVEKIREGESVQEAGLRLAKRASRYAVRRPDYLKPLKLPPSGI